MKGVTLVKGLTSADIVKKLILKKPHSLNMRRLFTQDTIDANIVEKPLQVNTFVIIMKGFTLVRDHTNENIVMKCLHEKVTLQHMKEFTLV